MKDGKLGIALVGLGKYSEEQLATALQQTTHCYLAGIVTGTPEKIPAWKEEYKLPDENIYSYETFNQIKNNAAIDIVYVVLPNSMHAEYAIKAAAAGKHVICEKPMALSVEDCDRMIAACKAAGKSLSIGYRLHFEPHNQEAMRLGQQNVFGAITLIEAEHSLAEVSGWRIEHALSGGGPLMDVGIYCVQAVRYVTGQEPLAVTAQEGFKSQPEKFPDVEEAITWQMEMPGGVVAKCASSYTVKQSRLRVETENGWFELLPAYSYAGIEGKTIEGKMDFPQVNQQAAQMDAIALAIKEGRPSPVPGEEGRRDVEILQAIYTAMRTGERVTIGQ